MQSLQTQAEAIAAAYIPPDTGRPSDIADAALLKELFAAIEDGNYMETACDLVGLSHVTVFNWKRRGEAGERPYDAFVNALKAASARAEAKMLANVRKASELPQFWAAGMTVLERRHPDRWGKRQDDNNQPKVVVNIGVGAGDVKVGIAFAPTTVPSVLESQSEAKVEADCNSLQPHAFAESSSLIRAVMSPNQSAVQAPISVQEAIGDSLRPDREGDPTPVTGAERPSRTFFSRKGRATAPKRKKASRGV